MPVRTTLPWDQNSPLAADLASEEPRELLRVTDVRWADLERGPIEGGQSHGLVTANVPDGTVWLIDHISAGFTTPAADLAAAGDLRWSLRVYESGIAVRYAWFQRAVHAGVNINLASPIVLESGQCAQMTFQWGADISAARLFAHLQYRTAVRN